MLGLLIEGDRWRLPRLSTRHFELLVKSYWIVAVLLELSSWVRELGGVSSGLRQLSSRDATIASRMLMENNKEVHFNQDMAASINTAHNISS